MKNTILTFCLAIVTVGLLIVCLRQRGELTALKASTNVGALPSDRGPEPTRDAGATATARSAAAGTALDEAERATYRKRIRALDAELNALRSGGTGAPSADRAAATPAGAVPAKPAPMAGMAEMLKSPGMKEMIRAQQKATLDMTYSALFEYLALSPDDLEVFKQLLVDRQMAMVDAGLSAMDPSLSPEDRAASQKETKALTAEHEEKIKAFLGEEPYKVYKEYEDTQPERMQVGLFKQALPTDAGLAAEQEHELILSMHEERTNFVFTTEFDDQDEFDPSLFTGDNIDKHLAELARLQERYTARAKEILTVEQLAQFRTSQDQHRSMQEMGLKMASQMFGGDE